MIDYVPIMYFVNNLTDTQKQSFNVVINGVIVIPITKYWTILNIIIVNTKVYTVKTPQNLLTTLHIIFYINQRKMNEFIMH